jgi:predicted O-methyltransferase YrrM
MTNETSALDAPQVQRTLERLHLAAKGDRWIFMRAAPAVIGARLRGRPVMEAMKPHLKNAFIPISPDQGRFLYQTARLIRARTIVEFGTSFGISAIYLAAAARANGGRFIGSELEPHKVATARAHLAEAGLADVADVREGDALATLSRIDTDIDVLLLDGWKDLYLPMLKLLRPKLKPGAVVFADNIFTFPTDLAPFVAFMRDPANGFESMTMKLGAGLEYSVCVG